MSVINQNAKAIFHEACERSDASERATFLAEACNGDHDLRQRVDRLLAAHQQKDSLFDRTASLSESQPESQPEESVGQMIGPYKLLQKIGEGGMGVVYMAEQKQPVKRRVALKIIKPGMDSRQVLARFEAERQALAMMDHPNIARVLEAGTTNAGRPYFVMELVRGIPITEFCDQHQLRPHERLELFVDVCQAVQHAHQKGIIHRDLKPNNVLVAKFDDKPVVKVIDFGVAKATNQELTERTMFTQFGQIVGTLEYMSPEQAQFNQLDIDTRSDVYSLGVLLYELLVSTPPFDRQRLRTVALDEVMRIIREEEPPKPSTRLSTLREASAAVSSNRKTNSSVLGKAICGDVDLIVMTAMNKDRSRRYETASAFAADVRRYLAGEAIDARAPSTWYRLQKTVARNKGLVTSAAAVVLAITIGLGIAIASMQNTIAAVNGQRDLMKEQILLAIMGGDFSGAQSQLEVAEKLRVSETWVTKMKGLSELLQGKPDDAVAILEPAADQIDSSPAGFALLAHAYSQQGDEDELFRRLALLRDMPDTMFEFEDHLLVGWSMSRWLPRQATRHLEEACRLNRSSLIARMLLGDARCWLAASLEDRTQAIETAREAIKDLEAVRHLLRDDPRVDGEYAHGRLTLAHLLGLSGDESGANEELESQRSLMNQLNEHPDHSEAVWMCAIHLMLRCEDERVLEEFEQRRSDGIHVEDYLALFLPSVCFRTNQLGRGLSIFDTADKEMQEQAGSTRYFLELSKPEAIDRRSDLAVQFSEELQHRIAHSSSKFYLVHDWAALKMLGEHEEAMRVAEILYHSSVDRSLWAEEIACTDFMRGHQTDPNTLLENCHDSQIFTAYAHYVIAFDSLSRGDRVGAKHHFAAAGQTGDFQNSVFWWSRAFLSRVDDPTWLPWLQHAAVQRRESINGGS